MSDLRVSSASDRMNLFSFDSEKHTAIELKGNRYTLNDGRFSKPAQSKLKSFCEFFTNRLFEGSFRSRASRMSDLVGIQSDARHFRVDVDKNLLYRGKLPAGKSADDFIETKLEHARHGEVESDGTRRVPVFISKKMLEFLREQNSKGAMVSISSTGGWVGSNLVEELKGRGLKISEFDNKATFNERSTFKLGLFQKFRVLGDTDKTDTNKKRINIMLDDQWHQRAGFKHAIDAKQFGMG